MLASGYGVEETALLFSVGIRTEPEVIRNDYPDRGWYTIKIMDTNGDVEESGYFNLDDSIRQYDVYTYENHLLVRAEHQEPVSSRDGMVETRTYYPSGKKESVTQIFADDTGHTTVYDERDRQIASIKTVGGEVTYRSDITYVPWDENAKGSDNMRYVSVQSVSYTGQAALGATEGYLSTETYDEYDRRKPAHLGRKRKRIGSTEMS